MNSLVFEQNGVFSVVSITSDLSAQEAAALAVPSGVEWREVDSDDLPTDYRDAWTANFDDEPCAVTIDASRKATIDARLAAEYSVVEFDSWWIEQVEQGFRSASGILLGLTTEDVTLLTGNFVLAKEAAALSLDLPPIIDKDGVPHSLDLEDLTALMLEYGQYRAALSAEYATRKAAILTP